MIEHPALDVPRELEDLAGDRSVNTEPTITPDDEARYHEIMAEYDAAMRDHYRGAVPMCHFTPMTFHSDDFDTGGDGFQCEHCGHSVSSAEAWAKIRARKLGRAADIT